MITRLGRSRVHITGFTRELGGLSLPLAIHETNCTLTAFIDALFVCYSALTVTGLSTINLSTLTVLQQVILVVLMAMGDVVSQALCCCNRTG